MIDTDGDYVETVQEIITNNYRGDCDDFALFFYVIGKKLGIEVRYVRSEQHAWVQVKKEEKWINYESVAYNKNERGFPEIIEIVAE